MGAVITAWPIINSMNPSQEVLALATIEVDLTPVAVGSAITVMWRGKPVFIRHRTEAEISEARAVPLSELRDPQTDESRAIKPEYLVMIGQAAITAPMPATAPEATKRKSRRVPPLPCPWP